MTSALKKLPPREDDGAFTCPVHKQPLTDAPFNPVEPPVKVLEHVGFASPGAGWECKKEPKLSDSISPGVYYFNAQEAARLDAKKGSVWAALHRWKTHPGDDSAISQPTYLPDGMVVTMPQRAPKPGPTTPEEAAA
ncbi:MAG: hypothetical protein GC129_01030 [Proteobacteria bacterium]|nr:hypothetical protein [Pseudomonadota bacterium]